MSNSGKTIVYVDGENFIHRVLDSIHRSLTEGRKDLVDFQLRPLIEHALDTPGNHIEIRYYTTRLRLKGLNDELQAKLGVIADFNSNIIPRLIKQRIKVVRAGILRSREYDPCPNCGQINPYFTEKGVDVRLAVDMAIDAHNPDVDRLVLPSSDLDILPAIEAVRELGKRIDYLASSTGVNRAMTTSVNETITFTRQDLMKFLKKA